VTDPTVTDLRRELEKARYALVDAQSHLSAHAQMNAALHCATEVFFSPLHAKVTAAIQGIDHALSRTQFIGTATAAKIPIDDTAELVRILADLDRCQHGRHAADRCDGCGGQSSGNPLLPPGQHIGHGLRGDPIYVPPTADRWKPEAWRTRPAATEDPTP
jgi:hypothetical protein